LKSAYRYEVATYYEALKLLAYSPDSSENGTQLCWARKKGSDDLPGVPVVRPRIARKPAASASLARGDQVEVQVTRRGSADQTLSLPPEAALLIEALLGHLSQGERVAVLTEDQELSPNDAARILGISRPLVVHRVDIGDLPFATSGSIAARR
jgi:hypothetical protein